jgi:hypothetical protein
VSKLEPAEKRPIAPAYADLLIIAALIIATLATYAQVLVTWPLVMLLLAYWPLRRFQKSEVGGHRSTVSDLVVEKIPLFVIVAKSADAHNDLGIILFAAGKTHESIPEFGAALRLNSSLETARKNLQQAQATLASGQ